MNASKEFLSLMQQNKSGEGRGIYSVCSAHPDVIRAAMQQGGDDESIVLIESTSNQVDQFGGYTGMTPDQFVGYVHGLAAEVGFPEDRILLGGDHLGPNTWQNLPAREAMTKASDLVAAYVRAGYQKIHLDASMFCADDGGNHHKPLPDEIVAARSAHLCQVAERTWQQLYDTPCSLLYIIGTEVPVPGGAREKEDVVMPTLPEDAQNTIEVTRKAFGNLDLGEAWERVTGLVVQPGVEFGDDQVFHYKRQSARDLSRMLDQHDSLVYEAHSTDYQSETGLRQLVEDHYGILKVGPWLTFAYREAIFALECMEKELLGSSGRTRSNLISTLEEVMLDNPIHWQKYYPGTPEEQLFKRKYSFSDRSRYYWPHPRLTKAVTCLKNNLNTIIPLSILSQYMPSQYCAVQEGRIKNSVEELIKSHIQDVLGIYARACKLVKSP